MSDYQVTPGDVERSSQPVGASDKEPLVQKTGRVKGIRLWLQQLEALLVKNATLTLRNKPAAVLQVLSTFLFILLIYGVAMAIEQQNRQNARYQDVVTPVVEQVAGIPDCRVSMYMKPNCYTLLWAPNTSDVAGNVTANIIQNIMANNVGGAIPASRVQSFATADAANAWMQQDGNFERTLGVYEFFVDATLQNIDFGIQINGTTKLQRGVIQNEQNLVLLPMQVAVEREIARYLGTVLTPPAKFGDAVTPAQARATIPTWDINLAEFPHPAESTFSLVGVVAPTFLLAAAMFVFTIQIFNVVLERELKLRSSMRVMGVSDGVWWLSWILWELCVTNVISALLICAFGNAFPFDLFRRNQFSVVFIHFWLFEGALTALGYFLSTFLGKANGSTFVGFTIFLFGFIFQLVVTLGGVPFTTTYGGKEYGEDSTNGKYRALQVIFSLFPPTVFAKGISDLGIATATDTLSGIKWRTRDSYCYCNPAFVESYASGAGAPPAPLDFKYLYADKAVSRLSHVCSAKDYQEYSIMFPTGTCDYSINECWQWLVLDTFFFLSLTFLFDQINKNEFGVRSLRIRNAWGVGSLAFFIVVLGVLLGVAGEPTGAIVAAMIIVFVDVFSVLAVLETASYNNWVVAVAIASHAGLLVGGLFVGLVFVVKCFISPEFKQRNAGVGRFMIFFAWPVMAMFWLLRDLGCCCCCAPAKESAFNLEAVEAAGLAASGALPGGLDDDVAEEEEDIKARLRSGDEALEPNVAVEVRGLVRSFGNFHAVRGNFFRVETGKLFALLGPNGAGKTTTINLLTGVLPITAGDASVCGHSLVGGGMPVVRGLMGVCPQFDILWAELTATEHLRLFAALKGLRRSEWDTTTAELLERTKLTPARDRRSSTYSGGMKRRLSVAVALIGDPEVVYLDEPTTGMDPITRRYVWDIILEAKQGRAIVLTTHSMEEADVLADTITIIAKGRLRCFGSALRLKSKFGAGYRIAVSVVPTGGGGAGSSAELARMGRSPSAGELADRSAKMVEFFRANLGVAPAEVGRVYTTFVVPRALEPRLAAFLKALHEQRGVLGVTDMQMSLTTLEQVFLLIARDAEKQAAAIDGRTLALQLPLEGGRVAIVDVPWGADTGIFTQTGEEVAITWLQDDEGRLQYAHHTWRGEVIAQQMIDKRGGCCGCC